jgi:hypothetical protein
LIPSTPRSLGRGHLAASGRVPLLIEGDDGTRLDKQAIAAALAPAAVGRATEHAASAKG